MYLSNLQDVAEQYAKTRVANGSGQPEVLTVKIERAELGRLLDLNSYSWRQFLRKPSPLAIQIRGRLQPMAGLLAGRGKSLQK
jgi:hypothetical protein